METLKKGQKSVQSRWSAFLTINRKGFIWKLSKRIGSQFNQGGVLFLRFLNKNRKVFIWNLSEKVKSQFNQGGMHFVIKR